MKNYFKITQVKTNEDVVSFNLDKFTGKVFFAMTVVGVVTTVKAVKKIIKNKGEINNGKC